MRTKRIGSLRMLWASCVVLALGFCVVLSVEAVLNQIRLQDYAGSRSPMHTALAFAPTIVVVLGAWVWRLLRSGTSLAAFVRVVIIMSPAVIFQTLLHGIRSINEPGYPSAEVFLAIPAGLGALVVYCIVVWRQSERSDRLFLVVANVLAILSSIPAGINE